MLSLWMPGFPRLFLTLRVCGCNVVLTFQATPFITYRVSGGNVPDFGRMFLTLKYTDLTQNTYIRS